MEWKIDIIQSSNWTKPIDYLDQKEQIAKKVAQKAKQGDVIGFGSGSTSYLAAKELAKRVKEEGLEIKAIPTSYEIEILCHGLGIPTTNLIEAKPDWGFDGADEVDPNGWMIKGRGGAMLREKLVMHNSPITYILMDSSKKVETLGKRFPIPVECCVESIYSVKQDLMALGANSITIRDAMQKDGPVITEQGNIILDTTFEQIESSLEKRIKQIVGVVESGLFIGYPIKVIKE